MSAFVVACGPVRNDDPEAAAAEAELDREAVLEALDRGVPQELILVMDDDNGARRLQAIESVDQDDRLYTSEHLPIAGVRLRSRESLQRLERMPGVLRVEINRVYTTMASANLELIGQPTALSRGASGSGVSVAIVDTGLDFTHTDFGSCASAGAVGCPVLFVRDFATQDNTRDDSGRHGTNVSSIVHAVAPAAGLIGLDVFDGAGASSLTIIAAIDWLISNRATYNIVAANFSLGYGGFTAPCPNDAMAVAMQRLRDAGVLPIVASGNSSYATAISSPACSPAAVSVGAVNNSGAIASFSNSASFLSVLAPGVSITGGGVIMSGTSQATPHVAGAVAALRSLYPSETPTNIVARLTGTGVSTVDTRNGLTFRRISLSGATSSGDVLAPTGTFAFSASVLRTRVAPYVITATDATGIGSMCMSTSTACTTFVPFTATGSVTFPLGDGSKTVRLWLRDTVGNTTTTPLAASVSIDTTPPGVGTLVATASNGQVSLTWSGFADLLSGTTGYRLVVVTGTTAPVNYCASGTVLASTTARAFVHSGLVNGTTYRYRVCALDAAGNVSAGAIAAAMPVPELTPPTGQVILAGGATWTQTGSVTAALSASDASGVASMCLSGTTSCTAWKPYATTAVVPFAVGSGVRTLYVWYRDIYGNAMTSPTFDSIRIDTQAPPSPGVSAIAGSRSVTIAWSAVTDILGGSGLASYRVATAPGYIPANCSTGTDIAAAAARTMTIATTTSLGYRVCATDVLGNRSTGTYGIKAPLP